ncbi:DUF4214 domain-containing protein [Noviherbaspirillum denitrificans]|uniref:DUF4214 domain-containing protein n=1 Tax=Noviherbaspirillum denitrificans TaxID=1968433 RepID=A0A254TBG9_9BURK|nr:DUF4214 domain-containing protein [Noviherbaspirillum denitrificans]OWW20006.1 hypothetical protein AYR66_11370 [Noviherbaspirillum denitrificans]
MALTATQTAITKIYLGAFNRAPEKSGLEYWTAEVTGGKTLDQVTDIIFSLPVVKAIYPDTMSNSAFLTAVYTNVFGKAPDADGLAYWNAQLTAGQERGRVVSTMIDAGLGTPDGTPGKAFIANRMQAAVTSADLQLTRGIEVDEHKQATLMQDINETPASLTAGLAAIDAATPTPIAASGQATGTATAVTDRFVFANADATNFKVINGLAVGDQVSVANPDNTNGDFHTVAEANAGAVNAHGEWFFDSASDNLTYWNNEAAAAVTVQLTGVATLSADTNAILTVTALG